MSNYTTLGLRPDSTIMPRNAYRYSPYQQARRILSRAARNRFARSNTRTATTRRRVKSGHGVSVQHDRTLIYRKRNMPRRRKRRWRRFIKKSVAANEKDLGARTVVRNELVTSSQPGASGVANTTDVVEVFALYSHKSALVAPSTQQWLNDLARISQDTDVDPSGKFIFQSGVLDLTLTNTTQSSLNSAFDVPMEVDIYEISAKRNFASVSNGKTLRDLFIDAGGDTPTIPAGAVSGLGITTRGTTPFDFPNGISAYRLKIWKKTKYRLSGGQSLTYQMRDPKRHTFEKNYLGDLEGTNYPGVTRWIMVIAKPIAGFSIAEDGISRISTGCTRKYMYKIKESDEDKDATF